jgi:membrane associated rhomboid family serine protease
LLLLQLTSCTANQKLYSTAFAGAVAGGVTGFYVTRDASTGERVASVSALAAISGYLSAWFVTELITMQEK